MQLLLQIILSSLVYSLIGLSFSVIYSTLGFFHLAHAISLTLGGYLVYSGVILLGWPFWVTVPLSVALVALLMLAVNGWVYYPLKIKGLASWQMMIASLGIYVVLQNVISMVWGDSTLSFRTWEVKVGHNIMGAYITDVQIITIVTCLALLALMWLFMEKTTIGKQVKAVSSNPNLSGILGLSKDRVIMWGVGIGTALVAVAGILIAADTDMTPTMGFNWLLYGVVALTVGGLGKIRYLVLGALILATAQHLAAFYLDSKWMNATAYIILIVFLYFRPYGFSGKQLKKSSL